MAYRTRYGSSYQPFDGGEDPLAMAIHGFLGGVERGRAMRHENVDRARRQTLEDEDRALREEEIAYRRQQDAIRAEERQQAVRDDFLLKADERGVRYTGNMAMPFVKAGPTGTERRATLEAEIDERLQRPDLLATAQQLGIEGADDLPNPRLRVAIRARESEMKAAAAARDAEAKAAADNAKSTRDFEEQRRLKAAPSYDDLHPKPKEEDLPAFLKPDAVSSRAAGLTRSYVDDYGSKFPGLPPEEAAEMGRRQVGSEREAAFNADRNQLRALYKRAYDNASTDEERDRATQAYMAAEGQLLTKYRIGQP